MPPVGGEDGMKLPLASCADGGSFLAGRPKKEPKKRGFGANAAALPFQRPRI